MPVSILIRLLLAAVFVVAGFAKLADPAGSRKSMAGFGVPRFLNWPFVWLLPVAEILAGIGLLPSRTAWWAALGALGLLLLFIAGISINLAQGRKPDCHCFGQLHSTPVGAGTLTRNGLLAGLATLILWPPEWLSAVSGTDTALAGLAGAGAWFGYYLLQQNGRLLLRIEALEARLEAEPAAEPEHGLPLDTPAPEIGVPELDGDKPVVLVFTEPGCSACEALEPDLAEARRVYAGKLLIVPVQTNHKTSEAYGVHGTPSAVVVRDRKIASQTAAGADPIRALIARASLPAAVNKGDAAPELRLPDLSGAVTDLGRLRGRRTLLLFWSPQCGYCQEMLPEFKAWEQARPPEAPELLVISSGSLEEINKQGFQSRVLLDQNFAAGDVFKAGGTPSAVLLEGDGRVASDVAVGAQAVLALAQK